MSKNGAAEDLARTADGTQRVAPFGAPHVFVLAAVDGADATVVHRLSRPETIVGRGEESHIAIEDDKVSRAHCRIKVEGSVCTLFDSGSRNGTMVNGRKLQSNAGQRLRHLDEIEIGSHRFVLLVGRFREQPKPSA
ncbi:MAG TPA: FHA domain-containing protein [Candidatus Polarisedimenticolia bacterium]|nr:FHA domain-containing protein [Candidatus Polarisedimenticolia bacterium]